MQASSSRRTALCGWGSRAWDTSCSRKAVTSRTFPLLEIEDGKRLTLTDIPDPTPVREYIQLQGRFRHFSDEQIQAFEEDVAEQWRTYQEWARKSASRS